MLELKDFFQLPQVEPLVAQLVDDGPGLVIVAGLDPRLHTPLTPSRGFLPSGRAAVFRTLMRQMLEAHPTAQATIIAGTKEDFRIPPSLRRRTRMSLVESPSGYAEQIALHASQRPDLLVIDRLDVDSAPAALEAAKGGLRVLSQLDTVFRGAGVARHLLDLGVSEGQLKGLAWVLAVQRLLTLCSHCKEPAKPDPAQLNILRQDCSDVDEWLRRGNLYCAPGCHICKYTGREGEIAALDVYYVDSPEPLQQSSVLSLETYMLGLAARGYLPLDDVLHLEADQLRRTYHLLTIGERALANTNAAMERKVAELEAANCVLQQRTQALISLESIGQALITSTSLDELAARLCRHARDLCGAERAILYYLHSDRGTVQVLAMSGWDPALMQQPLEADLVFGANVGREPVHSDRWPPGVPHCPTDLTAETLRAGLSVPLVAQDRLVGLMIVHTSQKPRFAPGEVALLQTFANQAALAIQRTGLTEALREKIVQLEIAQGELVQKERMERELELARQVQQSVLPRTFPMVPGYAFAAGNEPARQVGGDFYDVILLDAERFGVVIGDVSDKGMPAALYMALTRSLLLAEARREGRPSTVLRNVHRLLLELGQAHMFVTMFYGIVDGPGRQLTYARAGHDRPLLIRGDAVRTLPGEGTFVGFPGLHELGLSEEELALVPGDCLVLYTDGLTDALAPNGQPFGLDRLKSLLRSHAALSPHDLCAKAFQELTTYRGNSEQYDDMTMLVVQVN